MTVMSATFSRRSCSLARLASCSERDTDWSWTSCDDRSDLSLSRWYTVDSNSWGRGGGREVEMEREKEEGVMEEGRVMAVGNMFGCRAHL